jgi:hypothetical protein
MAKGREIFLFSAGTVIDWENPATPHHHKSNTAIVDN